MLAPFKDRHHGAWLLLVLATGITCWVRVGGIVGLAAAASTLAIGYFKGRLVILDFMELHGAPTMWRAVIEGWLLLVSILIFAVYWFSLAGRVDA
jgi:hypothetical protein